VKSLLTLTAEFGIITDCFRATEKNSASGYQSTGKPETEGLGMTKSELVEAVAKAADISKNAANSAVDAAFENIARAIRKEKRVQVPSFGTFTVRSRKAHKGRDPQTGSTISIKASKTVGFKPAPTLKKGL
jgi:DNA-binding protein HU-beta